MGTYLQTPLSHATAAISSGHQGLNTGNTHKIHNILSIVRQSFYDTHNYHIELSPVPTVVQNQHLTPLLGIENTPAISTVTSLSPRCFPILYCNSKNWTKPGREGGGWVCTYLHTPQQ